MKIGIMGNPGIYRIMEIVYRLFVNSGTIPEIKPLPAGAEEDEGFAGSNAHFDLLVINNLPEEEAELPYGRFLIVNSDEKPVLKRLNKENAENVITYGFNNKACVTASSVGDKAFSFCVQRAFSTFSGNTVVQQEFTVNIPPKSPNDIYAVLAAVTTAIIGDIKTDAVRAGLN